MNLSILKYNSYYNRLAKYYRTLTDYKPYIVYTIESTNFNPADGVDTTHVVGVGNVEAYDGTGDYLIAYEDNIIVSRWFIIESTRTRVGQYQLTLHRDLIVDYYNVIRQSPMFIEKATLPLGDPLLFNKENISFNQIKTSEHLLKDSSECAWIVGYVDKKFNGNISVLPSNVSVDYDYTSLDQYPYNTYASQEYKAADKSIFRFNWYDGAGLFSSRTSYCFAWDQFGSSTSPVKSSATTGQYYANYIYKKPSGTKSVGWKMIVGEDEYSVVANTKVKPFVQSQNWSDYPVKSYVNDVHTSDELTGLLQEDGKLIRVGDTVYKVSVYLSSSKNSIIQAIPQTSTLGLKMAQLADILKTGYYISRDETPTEPVYEYECSYAGYKIEYIEVSLAQFTAEVPTDRLHSQHLPYDIFCIPYGDITIGNSPVKTNTDYAIRFANEIIRSAGSNLYDIQLLPYCPIIDRVVGSSATGDLRIMMNVDNGDFTLKTAKGTVVSAGIWINEPDFSLTIPFVIERPTDAVSAKISNECDLYRIVSPNYNGEFEFSPAKNNGVAEFIIDCSYKPFTPYIKVSPSFGGLYGGNFGDARGLICGGDFSLTQATDTWVQYQTQNKNYQIMFDRQIQSMDINNNIQREQERWAMITGIVGGAAAGAATGGIAGGAMGHSGIGAGIGAAVGGVVSGIAGARDLQLQEQLRQEARNLAIDQFGYQLQNIAARPASLTKVASLNKNNKLFPFIEYFTCSDREKQAFRNKLLYNGMTVMAIGTMNNYIQTTPSYIKGKLIRLEGISDDYHLVNSISEELNKGVYI